MERIGKPFGAFKDFADCVARNQDKRNPEGWCADLHHTITGQWPTTKQHGPLSLTREEVAELCADCGEKMASLGMRVLKFERLTDLPPALVEAIALKATDPGFMQRCLDDPAMCGGADSKEGCCAALHQKLFGIWPGEHGGADAKAASRDWIQRDVPIAKVDEERRVVLGVVYEPDIADAHGDGMTADQIERTAHGFMVRYANFLGDPGVDHRARVSRQQVVVVESYLAQEDFTLGDQAVRKGSWVMGMKLLDDDLWAGVKGGRFRGFSLQGWGRRRTAA